MLHVLGGSRLATVVGPGGAGKTRLATEVGRAWQAAHGGAASIVELAPVRDESGVLPAFLAALDLRETLVLERIREARRGTDDFSLLVATLSAGPFLLVVDNCEHLLDATARLVEELLASCPELRMLATSREPLGRRRRVAVRPAAARPATVGRRAGRGHLVCGGAAVRRARLCGALGARPRRGDAAAGRRDRPPPRRPAAGHRAGRGAHPGAARSAEVANRLSDRFRLLTGGRRTALPRHQTLRAVVEWSWDLLTADERLLAERLAVFPAGATTESATAVCADERLDAAEVPTLLGSLVDKSLLTVDESHGLRYRMLETIREFGIDRLAERREVDEARLRHATYFADLVSVQSRRLYDVQQLEAAKVLDVEHDNILSAVRYLGDSE